MAKYTRSKATPARVLALELTRELRQRDAYLRELVDTARDTANLESEEFAYAQVLSFGVVMASGTLDEAINRSLNSPRDIKPKVRDALRISAYELLFLHKPAHVVVDQGVELVRHVVKQAAGLANAVLRKMVDDAQAFPWGDPTQDDTAFARQYGIAPWLATRLITEYGRERAAEILEASLSPAPTYLRENPFAAQDVFASDLSAQFVASLLPLDAPILEIGAGRGTKTMLIESRAFENLGHSVVVHAVDLHQYRAELLAKRMESFGIDTVIAHAGDACELDVLEGLPREFPSVLVDAPCSGTGTLRRHPEIRWRLNAQDVDDLASLQLRMLESAAERVSAGGTLIYATCSVLVQENEELVQAFLKSEIGSQFVVKPLDALVVPRGSLLKGGDAPLELPENWEISPEGYFASYPASDAPDGHFAVILQRR